MAVSVFKSEGGMMKKVGAFEKERRDGVFR